jgi:hypothetical protein
MFVLDVIIATPCHPKIEQLEKEKKHNPVRYELPKQLFIKYKKSGQPG